MEYEFTYNKINNHSLFTSLDTETFSNMQNYNPLYKLFFEMNENNCNNIGLNQKYQIVNMEKKISSNIYESEVKDNKDEQKKLDIFVKYSP